MKLKVVHRVRNIEGLECWAKDLVNNNNGNWGASYVELVVKSPPANAGNVRDVRSIPRLGNGNPLKYSCLENPINRGAWWAAVHRVTRVEHNWSDLAQHSTATGLADFLNRYMSSANVFNLCISSTSSHRVYVFLWDFSELQFFWPPFLCYQSHYLGFSSGSKSTFFQWFACFRDLICFKLLILSTVSWFGSFGDWQTTLMLSHYP